MQYKLYDAPQSGNCYKVRLLLHKLEINCDRININHLRGEISHRKDTIVY
ncbi:MAG: hypothetical protein HC903_08050 [Methylacidiphilales bacterium]|nr:hypothetical protein [Candidatus Methylacidiphilales bacterium]NJR15871.1 hypothetical protein [Calothrix sp. CSU_2_0]